MIPRMKPYLGWDELLALFKFNDDAVERFEVEFARMFETSHAISFAYGRSALWSFFKAAGVEDAEVVMPAYTCDVVAHAVVLSGNRPCFVDINLTDYNMNLDLFSAAITERTRAVIPTHLFGYPMDIETVSEIVQAAENRYGHKIWIIQDCAHAFGAHWNGRSVCNAGDVALFGLNISKMFTSIFGGMLTVEDELLAGRIRDWRNSHSKQPGLSKAIRRSLYLIAVYPAFQEFLYGIVYWLQEGTPLLNGLTKAYHLDEKIHFPPDYQDRMLDLEAQVGLSQLNKYPEIVKRRKENALYYDEHLQGLAGFELPPLVEGATYSHYVVRVADRRSMMRTLARRGIQLGQLIEYSVPHMDAYRPYAGGRDFQNSLLCSQKTINLPIHPGLKPTQRSWIAKCLIEAIKDGRE